MPRSRTVSRLAEEDTSGSPLSSGGASDARTFERSSALFDTEGRLIEWDEGFEREFAVAAPLIGKGASFRDILRFVFANDPVAHANVMDAAGLEGAEHYLESRLRGFGEDRSSEYSGTDGQIIRVHEVPTPSGGICRVARNVTALHRGEEGFAKAREEHRIQITEVAIWLRREPDGSLVYAPQSEEQKLLLGLPADFPATDPMSLYSRIELTPEEQARYATAIEESARTMSAMSVDFRTHGLDGKLKWIRVTMSPAWEPDGALLWTGVMRDVTREKLAEDQLELLRSTVVYSTDAIVIVDTCPTRDPVSMILYVNSAFERLLGYAADEIIGKSATIFPDPDPSGELARRILKVLTEGDSSPFEFQIASRDGTAIWVEGCFAVVQRSEGHLRWTMVIRDISERRRVREELVRAKDAAEAASHAKSRFLAHMSHELRTPLNAIIGFSEVMKNETFGPMGNGLYRDYANDIQSSGAHLLYIVNEVLEMSRVEDGKLELNEGPIDIAAIAAGATKILQLSAVSAGVTIVARVPPDFPSLLADDVRLKQMLIILLSNAIKFSEAGGNVVVEAAMRPDGRMAISVIDNGVGMTESQIANAFAPFHDNENPFSRRHGGTGLGLPLAQGLIKLHGGNLELASTPGTGTTASVVFPADRVLALPGD